MLMLPMLPVNAAGHAFHKPCVWGQSWLPGFHMNAEEGCGLFSGTQCSFLFSLSDTHSKPASRGLMMSRERLASVAGRPGAAPPCK